MLKIILLEKRTLLKGWLISLVVVFPFTFIPIFFNSETGLSKYVNRIPESLLYSAIFALLVVAAAVYHNYERLRIRIRIFNTQSFRALNGKWIKEGLGSISHDLSVSLLVHHIEMPYLLTIIIDEEDPEKRYLRISPYASIGKARLGELKSELKKYFKIDYTVRNLAIMLPVPDERLDDPSYIKKYMTLLHGYIGFPYAVGSPSEFSNKG